VSRFMASALLVWIVVFSLGCAGKSLGPVSAETLVGRWGAVTKGDADKGNATRDARTPTGEGTGEVTVYGCTEQAATCGKTAFVKPRPWIIGSPSRARSWQRGDRAG
jgi:hypothetical protein